VVRDVGIEFGGIAALKNVSFNVPRGDIVGLIGPNGAGKTTLFNCLSRIYRPSRGDILIDNRSILRQPQHRIAATGIGRTFQNVALFSTLSVRDNIRIGGHSVTSGDAISDMITRRGTCLDEQDGGPRSKLCRCGECAGHRRWRKRLVSRPDRVSTSFLVESGTLPSARGFFSCIAASRKSGHA
jgi:ABC-type sugar transport system ATPase subunit